MKFESPAPAFSSLLLLTLLPVIHCRAETANVALRGTPSANAPLWGNANIYKLIHGDKQTVFHGDADLPDGFAYLLDLGQNYSITHFKLHPRQDGCCPDRLSNFRISIHGGNEIEPGPEVWGSDQFTDGSNPGSTSGSLAEVTPPSPQTGRWIQIRSLASPVPDYALQMTELEAIGRIEALFGLNISLVQKQPSITWADGTLEQVSQLGDAWTPVLRATSPYTVPAGEPRRYYRLRR